MSCSTIIESYGTETDSSTQLVYTDQDAPPCRVHITLNLPIHITVQNHSKCLFSISIEVTVRWFHLDWDWESKWLTRLSSSLHNLEWLPKWTFLVLGKVRKRLSLTLCMRMFVTTDYFISHLCEVPHNYWYQWILSEKAEGSTWELF